MEELKFSYNWNGKIDNIAFTTLRLNSRKYEVGKRFAVTLKGQPKGVVRIEAIKPMFLAQINAYIAYLDTGYSTAHCQDIIRKMYPNVDFSKTMLALILLVKEETP